VVGPWILVAVVVVALVLVAVAAARQAAAQGRLRRREAEVRAALAAEPAERTRRLEALARAVPSLPAAEAAALVLTARRTASRAVIPILVAGVLHPDPQVSLDARRALADTGAPGLRAAWQAFAGAERPAPALRAFLLAHPDWLFERLVEEFVTSGEEAVRRWADLWREAGLLARLARMAESSDAVGAIRARAIRRVLDGAPAADAARAG